jgi:hypothetical protein
MTRRTAERGQTTLASRIVSTATTEISTSSAMIRTAQRAGADGGRRVRDRRRGRPESTGVSSGLGSGVGPIGADPMRLIGRDGSGVPGGATADPGWG